MELASLPQGRIARDDLNRLFYALQPPALDNVLKRLRDTGPKVDLVRGESRQENCNAHNFDRLAGI